MSKGAAWIVALMDVPVLEQDLWSEVAWGAAHCVGAVRDLLRKPKIAQLDIAFLVQKHVLGLQIAVDQVARVHVLQRDQHRPCACATEGVTSGALEARALLRH